LWLTALLPLNSLALGLGEIEVNSFLNQPLNAEIEVISARPGEVDDLLVSLASREAFTRAGLARPQHLLDLRFSVKKSEDGSQATIVVSSRGAIKEPFLNFLIEADWSKGRLLREFTLLLDPPFFAEQPAAAEPASETATPSEERAASEVSESSEVIATVSDEPTTSSETVTEPVVFSEDTSSSQSASPPASSEYVADESKNIIEGDVLVVKGDTLWSIASRYKDDAHSMAQVMLAFQRTNPDAFTDGNINNLKVGSVLRAPSRDELDAMGEQAAYAEMLLQNGLWDEYVARVSGGSISSGGSDASTTGGDSAAQADGELSLLMPGEGDSESTGIGDSADVEQLRTKLALAEEELEATRIENKDLESRIAELQARLSKVEELQKMVEIEDDSLAQLQADQESDSAQAEAQDSVEATAGEDAISETIQADEEALLEELLAEEAAAQAEEEAAQQPDDMVAEVGDDTGADDVIADDGMVSDEIVDETAPVEQVESDQMTDEETQTSAVTPPPAPVIITEPAPRSSSIFDGILPPSIIDMIAPITGLLGDPIVLGAIGGVIVLLLVLVVVKRRKAAQDDDAGVTASADDDLFASDDEDEFTPIHMTETDEHLDTDIKVPSEVDMDSSEMEVAVEEEVAEEPLDEFGATAIIQSGDMPEPEAAAAPASAAEQDDVLNEVDVYLAYGLYDNAEDLLVTSLGESPDRADYRSKLLDTYFATKNVDAFVGEAEKLKGMGDSAASYWDRVQIMGYELAPDNGLFSDAKDSGLSAADLEIAKPQEADFDLGADDEDDTSFSTTDFNLGEEDTGTDIPLDGLADEAGDLSSTQQVSGDDELLSFDDDESGDDIGGDLLDLPDDIGEELEFSMDDEETGDELPLADELEIPDELEFESETTADDLEVVADLDLEGDQEIRPASEETELELLDEDQDEGFDLDTDDDAIDLDLDDDDLDLDDALELSTPDEDDPAFAKTSIITPNYEETAVISRADSDAGSADSEDSSEIDLGMEDTAIVSAVDTDDDSNIDLGMEDTAMRALEDEAEATGELLLDDDEDSEDISIIDFGGDDFVEPTAVIPTVEESDDDDLAIEDDEAELIRTGTFAPGDFDAPTEAVASIADVDDIDDLMLPDDVDEVSTKLDLARAFIDMGDTEGARGSLEEVMSEGNADQKAEAKALLDQI
jgi:pilus assembly protein FimV